MFDYWGKRPYLQQLSDDYRDAVARHLIGELD